MGRLTRAMSVNLGYNEEGKREFHSAAKQALRRLYKILKMGPYMAVEKGKARFKKPCIYSNQGGIAVSGEVTLHSDGFYVQVCESALGFGHEVMYRAVKDQLDFTGGVNHWATAAELEDTEAFAKKLVKVLEEGL